MASFFQPPIGLGARKLKIQRNGVDVATFSANEPNLTDGTDAPMIANIEIPTSDVKTSTTGQFNTTTGGLLESCDVTLTPKQDLHGYSKPWVGGSGKNKLNSTLTTTTQNGITYTPLGDGTYNLNGTAATNGGADFATNITLKAGSYKIVGLPSNVGSSSCYIGLMNNNSYVYKSNDASFTLSADTTFDSLKFRPGNGKQFDNVIVKPMITTDLTATYDDFEPYANICPITGHTAVEVGNVGKNLLDESSAVQGTLNQTTGAEETSSTVKRSDFMMINASNVFQTSSGGIRFFWYDSNKSYISNEAILSGNSLSVPNTARYFRVIVANAIWDNPIMINSGTTETDYEPYQGQDITINLGGTYYGGTLDVVSGVFTGIVKGAEFDGSNDEIWSASSGTNFHQYYSSINDSRNSVGAIVNRFGLIGLMERGLKTGLVDYATDNIFRFALKDDELLISDVNAWRTWLSSNPIQVVYYLATPLTIQFTPQQINTLIGENNIDVPLTGQSLTSAVYRDMFAWDDVEEEIDNHLRVIETSFTKNPSNTWLTVSNDSVIRSGNHVSVQINFSVADMPTVSGSVTLGTVPYAMKGGYKFGKLNDGSSPFASRSEGVFVSSTNKNLNLCAQLPNGPYFLSIDYITAEPI